jgi:hypothetical protein
MGDHKSSEEAILIARINGLRERIYDPETPKEDREFLRELMDHWRARLAGLWAGRDRRRKAAAG